MDKSCIPHCALRSWMCRVGLAVFALLLGAAVPVLSFAHPIGNFTINHYSRLEVGIRQIDIFYVLDMAEIPAFQAKQQMDSDGNNEISPTERTNFAQQQIASLQKSISLTINGIEHAPKPAGKPELSFLPGQGGLETLRLSFLMEATLPSASQTALSVEYRDLNNTDRIGWHEIIVRGRDGAQVRDSTVSDIDVSNELRSYPKDLLSTPLNQTSARFTLQAGSNAPVILSTNTPQIGSASNDGAFAALITVPQLDLPVVLLALATALGLGALHALEPGHGKTAAAAYLVGARATPRHAVFLGLTITAVHTSSVFLLGLVTLFAAHFIVPERLLPWLGLFSGLIVIVLGIRMFFDRISPPSNAANADMHSHGGRMHTHTYPNTSHHAEEDTTSTRTTARTNWRGVLAIGISGGMLPCPAALIVLLSAIGLGRLGFGLLLIIAFSGGLAIVLSSIGLAVLYGSRWMRYAPGRQVLWQSPSVRWIASALPAWSALLVVGAGLLLLYHALPLLQIWRL